MNCKELYEYHGAEYSITRLSKMAHLHRDTIRRRLERGLTIEEILEPVSSDRITSFGRQDIGKQIPIIFTEELPVFDSMQPILGKQYMATICGQAADSSSSSKLFFLIELSNGKKLITYPGEFELVQPPCKKKNTK